MTISERRHDRLQAKSKFNVRQDVAATAPRTVAAAVPPLCAAGHMETPLLPLPRQVLPIITCAAVFAFVLSCILCRLAVSILLLALPSMPSEQAVAQPRPSKSGCFSLPATLELAKATLYALWSEQDNRHDRHAASTAGLLMSSCRRRNSCCPETSAACSSQPPPPLSSRLSLQCASPEYGSIHCSRCTSKSACSTRHSPPYFCKKASYVHSDSYLPSRYCADASAALHRGLYRRILALPLLQLRAMLCRIQTRWQCARVRQTNTTTTALSRAAMHALEAGRDTFAELRQELQRICM